MNWWVYKCNSNERRGNRLSGDWDKFFKKVQDDPEDNEWGGANNNKQLGKLAKDDMIIAYQTNRNQMVGICQVSESPTNSIEGRLHLSPIHLIEPPVEVSPLKKQYSRIRKIKAFGRASRRTLQNIPEADARYLLAKAGVSILKQYKSVSPKPDIQSEKARLEGEKRTVETTVRDPRLRADAKVKWGRKCYCCGFEFGCFYGDIARDVAIVHHLKMFKGKPRKATVQDVRVVCANCHQVIHVRKKPINVDDLKEQISAHWTRWSNDGIKAKVNRKNRA